MSNENELDTAVKAVETKLETALEKYEGQVKDAGSAANEARDAVKKLSEDYASVSEKSAEYAERIKELEQKASEGFRGDEKAYTTWGSDFVKSGAFQAYKDGQSGKAKLDVKNTILGEGGDPQDPENTLVQEDRLPGIVPGAFRALSILDFVPMGATNSNQIQYTRENAWTNNSAETAEAALKPESDLTFELVDDPVRTIAHFLRVSKQVLDDAPALQSYIDRRLRHGIQRRLQDQILSGDGTSPNISGLSDTGRHTAFTAEDGDTQFDSLNRAKYAVIAADYDPNFIFLNPADWGAMERIKASDDHYIAGQGNALSYINNGLTPTIWGLPVVANNSVPEGQFFLGDANAMQLFMRQGATVEMFEQDEDNVTHNLVTVRAELRGALAVFTPAAIQYGDLLFSE